MCMLKCIPILVNDAYYCTDKYTFRYKRHLKETFG